MASAHLHARPVGIEAGVVRVEVGHDQGDLVEGEHAGLGAGAELAVVDGQDDARRRDAEGALDLRLLEAGLGGADRRVDRGGGADEDVEQEVLGAADGDRPDQAAGPGLYRAAGQGGDHARLADQRLERVQAVADDDQVLGAVERGRQPVHGGGRVEGDRAPLGDQVEQLARDPGLGAGVVAVTLRERLGPNDHGAPADSARDAERLQLVEVAADGHLADAELARELVDTDGARLPDPLFDQVEPLVRAAWRYG